VRPEHRMIGHTGFLLTTRRLAEGVDAPLRRRRPAKGAYPDAEGNTGVAVDPTIVSSDVRVLPDDAWSAEALGERAISDKKIRRVRRDVGQAPTTD